MANNLSLICPHCGTSLRGNVDFNYLGYAHPAPKCPQCKKAFGVKDADTFYECYNEKEPYHAKIGYRYSFNMRKWYKLDYDNVGSTEWQRWFIDNPS